MSEITEKVREITAELLEIADAKAGQILIVGCSTSEVAGSRIGTDSSEEIAKEIYDGIMPTAAEYGVFVAAQCCEHLNRCLVVEREVAERYNLPEVSAVPMPHAGGSFAARCYKEFKDPVVVEHIRAHVGLDIGSTLIGMHLREVAVPVRLAVDTVGHARITCARTRPKYIGGKRTSYNSDER